ncbi:alcohol dehydrogenase catalytic domain-containing protein [Legionella quinlivanii]|uniref:alcohol dehydrogenase catalytic domain-containing protein n=1 Tax=Legionella quinlivanii TaxID=45073 RepID=UPI002244C2A6|nr:alcohol dehydrogenase catalytic domain-containing protein [Legionella quinlivanii]MCW8451028.1 alcohol dehydrogenase catalytic domain-containing protein [Legionella quinlivanii]
MRAAIVPAKNANWEIRDIPTPKPDVNQVLIKIHASGLCYTDVHQTEGHLPGMFPRTLGHEPVGVIVETGPGVSSRRVGDRVGVPWVQSTCGRCEWCLRGRTLFCPNMHVTGGDEAGGHAEYLVAPADATMLIPDSVSFEQAAPIFCAGYTVWSGLRWAEPKPHERVAVIGIGGLGHLAVQFAHAAGYETIAVSHSPDKDSLIKEMGADEIVRDGNSLLKMGGADIILSTTNSNKAMLDSLGALRPDGRFVAMGFDVNPLQISIADLIVKRIKIIGSQQNHREYLFEALDMVSKGKVKVAAETYSLNEINKAYEKVKNGQVRFRAVVTM